MAKPKTLEQLRAEKEWTDYTQAQIDRVNASKIFYELFHIII